MSKFLQSFRYAFRGIRAALADQQNLRVLFFIAVVVIVMAFYFDVDRIEWCIILLCIGLVVGLEMINSSIENLVDLVTLEKKPLAGKIKDIAAGAVLLVSILSLIVGVIIFSKYVLE
jgi:diacylglycerol kinase